MSVNREDLLLLLADGPQCLEDLAQWLGISQVMASRALGDCLRSGEVRHVGAERKWALASYVAPTARPHLASGSPLRNEQVHPVIEDGLDPDPDLADIEEEDTPSFVDDLIDKEPGDPFDGELAGVQEPDWDAPPVKRGPERPKKKDGLRQVVTDTSERGPSWWVGKSREEHSREAASRQYAMSQSPQARTITPPIVGGVRS